MDRIIYREKDGHLVKGTIINLLIKDNGYHLVDLKIYADGYMDCLGEIDMTNLKRLFEIGKLHWKMPPNESLFIPNISTIWTSDFQIRTTPDEFIFEVIERKIGALKHGESVESKCMDEFRQYLIDPTDSNLLKLKDTWDLLPLDKQALFEVPNKDPLVRLMETKEPISRERREHHLRDYFEGEWLELK